MYANRSTTLFITRHPMNSRCAEPSKHPGEGTRPASCPGPGPRPEGWASAPKPKPPPDREEKRPASKALALALALLSSETCDSPSCTTPSRLPRLRPGPGVPCGSARDLSGALWRLAGGDLPRESRGRPRRGHRPESPAYVAIHRKPGRCNACNGRGLGSPNSPSEMGTCLGWYCRLGMFAAFGNSYWSKTDSRQQARSRIYVQTIRRTPNQKCQTQKALKEPTWAHQPMELCPKSSAGGPDVLLLELGWGRSLSKAAQDGQCGGFFACEALVAARSPT